MAINNDDVKLYESQRLNDEEDGGGRVTGTEVIDGNVNNLYRDISRIDRTIGDVALRKAFVGISTDNNDAYLGAHVILTEAPTDQNVSVLLFNTDDQVDVRKNARDRIEAFVVPSAKADWSLYGNQLEGQRSLSALQNLQDKIPEIGEVYRLFDQYSNDAEQYIRITEMEHRVEQFTYTANGAVQVFERRRLLIGISAPLKTLFHGGIPVPSGMEGDESDIYGTQVADASRYYGIQPLSANIAQGDLNLKVKSVYAPLVPSAKVETPLLDQYAGYTAKTMVPTASDTRNVSCKFEYVDGNQSRTYLQRGVMPGTLTITMDGGTFSDDGAGLLVNSNGSNRFSKLTINYENGEINVWRASGYFTSVGSAVYQPAAGILGTSISGSIEVTIQNRGFNYTMNLADAKPKPDTLVVSYIALGKWQDIRDTGNGAMTGAGTGNIQFATGTVALTLDAMPDPDSAIVYSYIGQNDSEVTERTGTVDVERIAFRHTVEKPGINPGGLTVTYIYNEETKTLTDQGNGLLAGDGTGAIHYAPGELSFKLTYLPDAGTEINIQYEEGERAGGEVAVSVDGQGVMTGTIPGAPLLPGSIQLQFLVEQDTNVPHVLKSPSDFSTYNGKKNVPKSYVDNTNGGWQENVIGTIDYQTGNFVVQAVDDYSYPEYKYSYQSWNRFELESVGVTKKQIFLGNTITAIAQASNLAHQPYSEIIPSPELTIDLLPLIADPLLPGSVIFEWNGETYFDREGKVYKDLSTSTNAGVQVGVIDYTGGEVKLATYPSGNVQTANLKAAATISAGFTTDAVSFRTAGSPLRAASLQLTAIRADTAQIITATADFNGVIDTAEMQGSIDASTGWAEIRFTDGTDPIQVIPQTVRFNTIVETSLPLDAELIGLDPIRLPPDGKVPIYRAGDIVVISHTTATDAGTPTAGQVITLNRDHQADIVVLDSNDNALNPDQYVADREAGNITFASPLSLIDAESNPLIAPFTIQDRVEHMSVVNDVQINGDLSIIAPVPWDLPAAETTVSSAVVYGDLQARVHSFFTQKVWDNGNPNWSDNRIGDNTTAQYNRINYPLEVTNKGAIYGKWSIIFTTSAAFQVVEEKLGIIDNGNISTDTAPINPETGVPYFTIKAEGWGTGWAVGNAIRFNTDGCLAPVWVCRTVLAGQGTEKNDKFTLQIRGDAD